MYDSIIIGSGPAGLTAGLYLCRARLNTLLVEDMSLPSQVLLTNIIENYPGFAKGVTGIELIETMKTQTKNIGLKNINATVKKIIPDTSTKNISWQVITDTEAWNTLSVVIATGARRKKLNVPGETALVGKGVSYCATCDGPLFNNKDIAVVGGGDTALEEALYLTKYAHMVIIIHRREELRATKILQERILGNKKISLILNTVVKDILGKEKVEGIRVVNVKTGEEKNIICAGVFVSIGLAPNTDFIRNLITLDENGYIITQDDMSTSKEGIFACGDCRKKTLRQIVTACADGAIAAYSIQQYIAKIKEGL